MELVGSLRWRGSSGPDPGAGWMVSERTDQGHQNDFARWIRGTGAVPDEHSTMNSWEALLFSAYRAGAVGKSWLVEIHEGAAAAAEQVSVSFRRQGLDAPVSTDTYGTRTTMPHIAYGSSLMRNLHSGDLMRYTRGGPAIPAGNIIFFDGLDHVALSLGTRDADGHQRVLSLLDSPMNSFPDDDGWMQITSIEELMEDGDFTVIEFGSPPWERSLR